MRIHVHSSFIYCQYEKEKQQVFQALHFEMDESQITRDDFCIEISMLEFISVIAEMKKADFKKSQFRKFNENQFLFLFN